MPKMTPPTPPGDRLPETQVVVPAVMHAQQVAFPAADSQEIERLSASLRLRDSAIVAAKTILKRWAAMHGEVCACGPCSDTRKFMQENP